MRAARWLAIVALLLAMAPVVGVAAQSSGDLDRVRARLAQITADLAEAERQAGRAVTELADADARLAEVEAIVNELSVRLERQEQAVLDAEADLAALQAEADRVLAAFQSRAVAFFKRPGLNELGVMFAGDGLQDALDRRALFDRVQRSDAATIEHVRAAQGAVETQQEVLEIERDRLAQAHADQQEVLAEVQTIRQSRLLASANAQARVVELTRDQENLEGEERLIRAQILAAASAPAPAAPGNPTTTTVTPPAAPSAGGYIWPAPCGAVSSEYGRRWGRMHRGIDITARQGSGIVAARAGVVVFAGWQGGYGQLVRIDHGGGHQTLYAHMSVMDVSPGQQVSAGQRIGTMGRTGNTTGVHVHFEVRINGNDQNPRNHLPRC